MALALQGLVELDPDTTIVSIDGFSACDLILTESMMTGLFRKGGGSAVLPFVRVFYGSPSEYLWEDNEVNVHSIPQGEGVEQGDALMPLLFCLGQQQCNGNSRKGSDSLLALTTFTWSRAAEQVGEIYRILEESLRVFDHRFVTGRSG